MPGVAAAAAVATTARTEDAADTATVLVLLSSITQYRMLSIARHLSLHGWKSCGRCRCLSASDCNSNSSSNLLASNAVMVCRECPVQAERKLTKKSNEPAFSCVEKSSVMQLRQRIPGNLNYCFSCIYHPLHRVSKKSPFEKL